MDDVHEQRVKAAAELDAKLDAERDRRELTWREVAQILGMTTQNLSRIRKGEISISRDAGKAIAKFLGGADAPAPEPPPASAQYEWSAATQRRVRDMPFDELLDFARDIYFTSGERAALLLLETAAHVRLERSQSHSDSPL